MALILEECEHDFGFFAYHWIWKSSIKKLKWQMALVPNETQRSGEISQILDQVDFKELSSKAELLIKRDQSDNPYMRDLIIKNSLPPEAGPDLCNAVRWGLLKFEATMEINFCDLFSANFAGLKSEKPDSVREFIESVNAMANKTFNTIKMK